MFQKNLTEAGFSCGRLRWDSLSAFGASLRPTLLAIGAIAPPKASLWSGKINQLHPFTAGGNNTQSLPEENPTAVTVFYFGTFEILGSYILTFPT